MEYGCMVAWAGPVLSRKYRVWPVWACPDGQNRSKPVKNRSKRPQFDRDSSQIRSQACPGLARTGQKGPKIAQNGPKWPILDPKMAQNSPFLTPFWAHFGALFWSPSEQAWPDRSKRAYLYAEYA